MGKQTQESGRELPVAEIQRHSGTRLPSKDDIFSVTQTRRAGKDQLQQIRAGQPKKRGGTAVPKPPAIIGTKPAHRDLTPRVPPKSTWNLRIHQRNIHGDVAGVINDVPATRDGISGLQAAMVTDQSSAEFDILGQLGMGNMGVVYRARQASLNRELAIKTLKPHEGDDSHDFQAMFVSEAVVTANLLHPNIVPIHDLGRTADGKLFYSMKQVSGTPWSRIIRDRSLEDNLEIFMKVCDAVAYAHSSGVVNRDLKPENVIVGGYGEVIVLDWGLAITTEKFSKRNSIALNYEGGWGTPPYMAPELLEEDIQYMGPHSDVYLLGAILFEVLQGFPPHFLRELWEMEDQDEFESMLLTAVRDNQIEQEVTHYGELHDVALRAMSTYPEDRFESVEALQDAIRQYRITGRAEELLLAAEDENGDRYGNFQGAIALYDEALRKWPGNPRAVEGNRRARLAYAELAGKKGDIDLGLQVVDRQNDPQFVPVAAGLKKSRRFRQIVRTTWTVMTVAVGILLVGITHQWNEAVSAKAVALEEKAKAEKSERELVATVGERDVVMKERDDVMKEKETIRQEAILLEKQKDALKTEADSQALLAAKNEREAREQSEKARAATESFMKAKTEADAQQQIAEAAKLKAEEESRKAEAAIVKLSSAQEEVVKANQSVEAARQEGHKIRLEAFKEKINSKEELRLNLDLIKVCEDAIKYRSDNKIPDDAFEDTTIESLRSLIKSHKAKLKNNNLKATPNANMSAISADGSTAVAASKDAFELLKRKEGADQLESIDVSSLTEYLRTKKIGAPKISLSRDGSLMAVLGQETFTLWKHTNDVLQQVVVASSSEVSKKRNGTLVTVQFSADSKRLYLFRRLTIEQARQIHVDIFEIANDSAKFQESLNLKRNFESAGNSTGDLTTVVLPDESAIIATTAKGQRVESFYLKRNNNGQTETEQFGNRAPHLEIGVKADRIFVSGDGLLMGIAEGDSVRILRRKDKKGEGTAEDGTFPFQDFNPPATISSQFTVRDLAFSADNSRVITAHDARYIQIWDRDGDRWVPSRVKGLFQHTVVPGSSLPGHSASIQKLAFIGSSSDELVSLSSDRTVRSWSISGYDAYWQDLATLSAAVSANAPK